MSTGPIADLKFLATGLGAGILIDGVIIRCLLVPAMVALFGGSSPARPVPPPAPSLRPPRPDQPGWACFHDHGEFSDVGAGRSP